MVRTLQRSQPQSSPRGLGAGPTSAMWLIQLQGPAWPFSSLPVEYLNRQAAGDDELSQLFHLTQIIRYSVGQGEESPVLFTLALCIKVNDSGLRQIHIYPGVTPVVDGYKYALPQGGRGAGNIL